MPRRGRCLIPVLLCITALRAFSADLSDEEIGAAQRLLTDSAGRPMAPDSVNLDLVKRLYSLPNALPAMRKVLAQPGFAELSLRVGDFRHQANLDIWSQIIRETSVRIELNNAGKKNGARSDLDNFFFTAATILPNRPDIPPQQIHAWLKQRHEELWRTRFGANLPPSAFDVSHFPGDSFMKDWRMNLGSWSEHLASLDVSIATLSGTEGAYFLPGAYKIQVYLRYLAHGETTVLTPSATEPNGVKTVVGKTRDLSPLYKNVPFEIDAHGHLENALQNTFEADRVTDPLKNAKYVVRIPEGQAAAFTNLEVELRHLLLTGQKEAFQNAIRRMYGRFDSPGAMPGVLGGMNEAARVIEVLNRIELDKIIGSMGEGRRPGFWSDDWKTYRPGDIQSVQGKLEYYASEVEAVRKARRLSDADFEANKTQVAGEAERLFHQKAAEVVKMSVASSAERVFREVFTEAGFARQRHLHGEAAALRLLAERVRGLHASLAVQKDDAVVRAVVEAAPAEVRDAVSLIAEIARIQRATVAGRKKIEARELRESDEALQRIMRRLRVTPATAKHGSVVSFDETSRNARWTAYDEILSRERRRARPTDPSGNLPFLPDSLHEIGGGMAEDLLGLGGADSAFQAYAAWLQGDTDSALQIFRDAIIEAVPSWGNAYSVAKTIQEARNQGDVWPLVKFAANLGAGAAFGPLYGAVMAVYGIETTVFNLAWHFYGRPTQEEAISYILMGDASAAAGAGNSRFPAINDRRNLQESALLRRHIHPPNLSVEHRRQVLRAHYFAMANRTAGESRITPSSTSPPAPGSSTWLNAREQAFDAIYRDWEFWLRRVFFYQDVHIRFFAWVQSQNSDPNWQRIDRNPPGILGDMSHAQRLDAFPDAFTATTGGGGYWDHERVWLRRFFEGWVGDYSRQWQQASLDHGEFMNALATHAPGWEKAVVDQLVGFYLEGEMLDLSREQILTARGPAEAGKLEQSRQAARAGIAASERRLHQDLEPARKSFLELANRIDNALWGPALTEHLHDALAKALVAQPPYQPPPPTLTLRIPDPVAALRQPLPIETVIRGDPVQLPTDLATAVSFRPTGRWVGRRPPGVLRWDVAAHLGEDVPDRNLVVAGADAEVIVTSPSKPQFRLQATAPVFFIGRLDQPEAAESPTGKVEIELQP